MYLKDNIRLRHWRVGRSHTLGQSGMALA